MPDFCKHVKYCCLHQNITNPNRIDNDQIDMNDGHNNVNNFNDNPALTQLSFDEINANNNIANFNAYCDDGKSMKLTRKYSIDASINLNPPSVHTGLQKSFEGFENCNYGNGKFCFR